MAIDFIKASNQTISIPYNATQMEIGSSDFALMGWIIYDSTIETNYGTIFGRWEFATGNKRRFWFSKDLLDGKLHFRISSNGADSGQQIISSTSIMTAGNIYHVLVQRKSNILYFYLNGVQDASTLSIGALSVPTDATIGMNIGQQEVSLTNRQLFDGRMWDLRMYNRSLSDEEIKIIYESTSSDNIVNGMTARWLFNEGADGSVVSNVTDISTTGNNGTDVNSPNYEAVPMKLI
jgi:hypothetical protein